MIVFARYARKHEIKERTEEMKVKQGQMKSLRGKKGRDVSDLLVLPRRAKNSQNSTYFSRKA